jgi:putative hydrolase of the HAD superfamily
MIDDTVRAVFFDAVGTLISPREPVARTYAECAHRHGLEVSEEHVRGSFREAFARQEQIDRDAGWRTDEARERARWQAIVSEVLPGTGSCFEELWAWFASPAAWAVHAEAAEVIRELADRGLAVGIASNFDARLLGLVDAFPLLAPLRWRCAISSLIGWRKPAPGFFAYLTQLAGCPAGQILHVGDDRRNDVDGAMAAGFKAILFDPHTAVPGQDQIARLRDLLPR